MNEYSSNLDLIDNQDLIHYGIMGMKWGVRRFQDQSGDYTAEGEARYADRDHGNGPAEHHRSDSEGAIARRQYGASGLGGSSHKGSSGRRLLAGAQNSKHLSSHSRVEKKSDHRLKLEAEFRKKGMSEKEAEEAADRRIKTEKTIAICAGVTIAAAVAAVAAKKYHDYAADEIIGTEKTPLLRVQYFDGIHNKDGEVYGVYDKRDNSQYAGNWAKNLRYMNRPGYANYNMKLVFGGGKGTKLASEKHATKIFNNMLKTDPEFKSNVETFIKRQDSAGIGKNTYEKFVYSMYGDGRRDAASQKFFETMRQHGYGAIRDVNDIKYSGFGAKSAVIAFADGGYKWSATKLSDADIDAAAKVGQVNMDKFAKSQQTKATLKSLAPNVAVYSGLAAGGIGVALGNKSSRANSMRNAGVPVEQIAKQLGISESEVYRLTNETMMIGK